MSGVDSFVGKRVRMFRLMCGIDPQEMSVKLGVGLQQLDQIEAGAVRVPAVQLFRIAQILNVPVTVFFCEAVAGPPQGPTAQKESAAADHRLEAALHQSNPLWRTQRGDRGPA
jgi:transcriptional regulator with XRE-family HTH domain